MIKFSDLFGKNIDFEKLLHDCFGDTISCEYKLADALLVFTVGSTLVSSTFVMRAGEAYLFDEASLYRTLLRGLSLKALRMKTTDWPALTDNERALAALERERLAVYSSDWDSMLQGVTTRDNVPPDMIFKAWFESQFPFLPNEVSNGVE